MFKSEIANFSKCGQTLMSCSSGLIDLLTDLLQEIESSLKVSLDLNSALITNLNPYLALLAETSTFSRDPISSMSTAISLMAMSPIRL